MPSNLYDSGTRKPEALTDVTVYDSVRLFVHDRNSLRSCDPASG